MRPKRRSASRDARPQILIFGSEPTTTTPDVISNRTTHYVTTMGSKRSRSGKTTEPAAKADRVRLEDTALDADKAAAQASMWASGELCDATLRVGAQNFRAHRVVLASVSPFFRRLFTAGGATASTDVIDIKDIEPTAFKYALDFAYSGVIEVEEGELDKLVSALYTLEMSSALSKCTDALVASLSPDNVLPTYELAVSHHLDALEGAAHAFALEQFAAVAAAGSFVDVELRTLKTLVGMDELHADEDTVLEAILRWVRHDEAARAPHLDALLPHVRFPHIDSAHMATVVATDALVAQQPSWPALRAEAERYQTLTQAQISADHSPRVHKRGTKAWSVYSIGGMEGRIVLNTVQRWNMRRERWEPLPPMLTARVGHGAAACAGQVYAAGGSDGTHRLSSVERFCPWRNAWEQVHAMSVARGDCGVAPLGGKLYAVGGRTHSMPQATVERYCPERDAWEGVASMSVPRYHVRAAALDGQLYAIGGGEQSRLDGRTTAERYHPGRNAWEPITPMSTVREGVGVGVLEGKLYATGGYDGSEKLNTVERYDPEANAWESIAPMTAARMSHRVAVLDGELYVLGGFKGEGECKVHDAKGRLSSVEKYCPHRGTWEPVPSMSADAADPASRWHCHGALVVH